MTFKKPLTGAAVALMFATSILGAAQVVSADSIGDTESAISANKATGSSLVNQVQSAIAQVTKLNDQVAAKAAEIKKTQQEIKTATAKISTYKTEIAQAQANLVKREKAMKAQLVSLQKEAGDSVTGNVYIDFALNASDFSDLVSRSFTINKLNNANKEALDAVTAAKTKLSNLKKDAEANKNKLESSLTALSEDKAKLDELKDKAQKETDALQAKVSANASELNALQSDLDAAKDKAQADAKAPTSQASATGSLPGVSAALNAGGTNKVSSSSAGNSYPYGECTWYAKKRSGWAGNFWGNGGQWGASAAAEGFRVDHTPAAGALIVFLPGQSVGGVWTAAPVYGHVGYVEAVNGSSVVISQGGNGFSNPAGPNFQTIGNAGSYIYIHA